MPSQEKIRVLIVDDIAETRENVRRLLQFDMNIEVVGAARSGQEAISLSQEIKPDVIIMDINMPDMDGITATEAIRRKVPHTQVVILSVQSDQNYMRRAMLAGARDFLTKPPSIDDLTSAIHRAGQMAREEQKKLAQTFTVAAFEAGQPIPMGMNHAMGKTIVVYSPKGGTGTTTVAINLALSLHTEESKVVLVDGSLQFGDIAVFLNQQVKNNILDLTPRVDELDEDVLENVTILHPPSGVRFIAAPPRPEMAEQVTPVEFGKLVKFLRRMYAYTVIDTCSYLTEVVQAALENADIIVLLTTQEIPAIKNASAFLQLADASEIKRDRILFAMNRYDKRISITPERVGESLRQPVTIAIPADERLVANSVNRGIPFVLDNKTHITSKSIFSLADIIKEKLAKQEQDLEAAGKK
jgi:pilus assembly protein CpaE